MLQRFLDLFISINCSQVSGGSSAHHQEHKTVHTASGIVKPMLLSVAIVDEIFHLIHDSNRQQFWFDNN
jgi:hypothetical protein